MKTKRSRASKEAAIRRAMRAATKHDGIPREPLGTFVQSLGAGLSRDEMAARVKDAPSQMSRLMSGHIQEFSADRLAKMARYFGCDLELRIRGPRKGVRYGKARIVFEGR